MRICQECQKEVGIEIERLFIKVRKAFIISLNFLGKKKSWNIDTLEKAVREKLPDEVEKRFFDEVIKFEKDWVLNRLEEERILKGDGSKQVIGEIKISKKGE